MTDYGYGKSPRDQHVSRSARACIVPFILYGLTATLKITSPPPPCTLGAHTMAGLGSTVVCEERFFPAVWDPLHPSYVSVGHGNDISLIDIRTMRSAWQSLASMATIRRCSAAFHIPGAHAAPVMAMDFAPSTQVRKCPLLDNDLFREQYRLATGCSDGMLKLWDMRQTGEEVSCVPDAHMHWPVLCFFFASR